MKFKISFKYNGIGMKRLTAKLTNVDNNTVFNILISHENDFNSLQDFYNFCICILKNKKDLVDIIEEELRASISEKMMKKHMNELEDNIFNLIDDLNKEDITIVINENQ